MDQRNRLSEEELRRVVQSRPSPIPPAFFNERVMAQIRQEHEKRLVLRRRIYLCCVAAAILTMLFIGLHNLIRMHLTPLVVTPFEQMLLTAFAVGLVLLEVQQLLHERFGHKENEQCK